jgi:PEP-CTERM motif-containing protein
MKIKAFLFVAILVFAAAFAPVASADPETFVLDVQGTDYSVHFFTAAGGGGAVELPLQPGTATLFADVVAATPLGTITLDAFEDAVLVETFSFTNATATSFLVLSDPSGNPVFDEVGFSYQTMSITTPTTPAPEPSALTLLTLGILCAAGVWLRRKSFQQ